MPGIRATNTAGYESPIGLTADPVVFTWAPVVVFATSAMSALVLPFAPGIIGHDLNIGTVVRTANAFLAAEVHIVGRRRWNRRGAICGRG